MQALFAEWPSGRYIKWRSLTWAEYKKYEELLLNNSPMAVYCDVYRAVVLEGPPLEGDPVYVAPAGIVEWLGRSIMETCPFSGSYTHTCGSLLEARETIKANYLMAAQAVIAGLFHYTFEEIEQWDAETFFARLAMAEYVSGPGLSVLPNPKPPRAGANRA